MGCATTNGTFISHAHPKAQGPPQKRDKKTIRVRGQETLSKTMSSVHDRTDCCPHELMEAVVACTRCAKGPAS